MSVTLFVEVEVKRAWRKRKFQAVAEAVGMWEARDFCELSKAVWEERKRVFIFPLFPYCRHFHSYSLPLFGIGCRTSFWLSNRARGKVAK